MFTPGDRIHEVSSLLLGDDTPGTTDLRTGEIFEASYTSGDETLVGVRWDHPVSPDDDCIAYENVQFVEHEDFFQ